MTGTWNAKNNGVKTWLRRCGLDGGVIQKHPKGNVKTLKDFKKGSSNRIKFAFLKDHFGWSIKKQVQGKESQKLQNLLKALE